MEDVIIVVSTGCVVINQLLNAVIPAGYRSFFNREMVGLLRPIPIIITRLRIIIGCRLTLLFREPVTDNDVNASEINRVAILVRLDRVRT